MVNLRCTDTISSISRRVLGDHITPRLPDFIVRWMCAFLQNRHQRVKIGDILSEWLTVIAGIPQGSYLSPLTFIILINGVIAADVTHKYVDDTTVTEFLNKSVVSNMQLFVDELTQQTTQIDMIINGKKTREMLIGTASKVCMTPVILNDLPIE